MTDDDGWKTDLERFDERTIKRRAKAKEQDAQAQEMIREAEERRDQDTSTDPPPT